MKTIELIQGTPEWVAHRAQHYNASDAPAMMGCGHKTRTELLHEKHVGFERDVSSFVQERVFDPGHRFESLSRPLAEKIVGQELYAVTGTNGKLSASFDGLTLLEDIAFEHKTLNDELNEAFDQIDTIAPAQRDSAGGRELPRKYQVQMEQQCMVAECKRVLFMASKWSDDGELIQERHCWYESNPALAEQIRKGWEQFEADLAVYVPVEVIDKSVAKAVTDLPAVAVQVTGALMVRDNFKVFEAALRKFIDTDLIEKPQTDQDFADLTLQIAALKKAEAALDAAEANMLSQVESVDAIKRTKEMLHKLARDNRLASEKRLEARKVAIKGEIVAEGVTAFREHIDALNTRLGKPYMPPIAADFGGVIKNLRTVESLRNAVQTELARVKIAANETADRIDTNLKHLRETASKHIFLFSDTPTIVLKAPDDLQALVANRINAHEQAEQKRLEEQREQIRKEEAERLEREARERQKAADAEAERLARATIAAAATPSPAPAPAAPSASPAAPPPVALYTRTTARAPAADLFPPKEDEKPTMKLGDISARLGFTVTADFLAELGFAATVDRNARLYRESQFEAICLEIIRHVQQVAQAQPA
jgi:predicted phage-related endonuclease